MSDPVKRHATYADLVDLPENVVGEIIDGDLYATPRPRLGHARLQHVLSRQLPEPANGGARVGDAWVFASEPELHFGDDVVVPDVAGWRHRRTSSFHAEAPWTDVAPDWLAEILSPSTARRDRVQKLQIYARAGVGHVWLIDPACQTLEVYRRAADGWLLAVAHGGDVRARLEPFEDGPEFDLSAWWWPGPAGP